MPPIHRNPESRSEQTYNVKHKSTRRLIECAYGIMKERFPCLNHLRLSPVRACKTVIACAVLHNIATLDDFNADIVEHTERADEDEQIDEPNSEQVETAAAEERLQQLLRYFS